MFLVFGDSIFKIKFLRILSLMIVNYVFVYNNSWLEMFIDCRLDKYIINECGR